MKKIIVGLILLFSVKSFAQTAALPLQSCVQGGIQATTSGTKSSNYLMGVVPYCTVKVYLTGTTTLATIFKDAVSTPQTNPFTATVSGSFLIYAAINQGYDVVLSGGYSPNTYATPVTKIGLYPSSNITIPSQGCTSANTIANGCTGATTAAGAWTNIFSGASIATNCAVLSTGSGGALTCSPTSYLPLGGGTLTGALTGTSASFSGNVAAGAVNSIISADTFTGSDVGSKINSAVAYWVANGGACNISVAVGGVVSTAPDIPLRCSLDVYAPLTISTTWPIRHHGVSLDFHNKLITANTGTSPVFDIGKSSALTVTAGTVNTSGSTVTWVSGATFSDVDLGDQITINGSTYNIATVNSSTSITTVGSVGTLTGVMYVVNMDPSNSIANNPTPAPPKLSNLSIANGVGFSGDAIRNTFTSDVVINGLKTFGAVGMVYDSRGAITAQLTGVTTAGQVSGVSLADYTFGGFTSGSNANVFYGPSFNSSASSAGTVISTSGTSNGNEFLGLHVEGNLNNAVITESGGGSDFYQFTDYERNGTGAGYEIIVVSSNNTFVGPSPLQSYNSNLMEFTPSSSGNTMRDLQPNVTGTGGVAYQFQSGSSGKVVNVKVIAGIIVPPPTGTEDSSNNYQVNNLDIVGIGTTGAATQSGASPGDFVLANGFYLRSDTNIHNATYRLIGSPAGTADVWVDPGGQGTTFGGTVKTPAGTIIKTTDSGVHGSTATQFQKSDGTGTSGPARYDANGNLTAAIVGIATLSTGAATVSNSSACTPSATCVYKLTNCGKNSSTGIGTLSVGTITAGTSFVINSLSPVAAALTTDASTVCWQIN